MVDDHYATIQAAWAQIHANGAVACVSNGRHLFSFKLRASAMITPPTLGVLMDSRYVDAAWLKHDADRLEELPGRFRQAPSDSLERLELFRLFDDFLLKGSLPSDFLLAPRAIFDGANERAYKAAHPDLYDHMVATKNVTCLGRIRNCGSLSPAQEKAVRTHMSKKAEKPRAGAKPQPPNELLLRIRAERAIEEEERQRRLAVLKTIDFGDDD